MVDDPVGIVVQGDVADEGETEPIVSDCAQRGDGEPQQLENKSFRKGFTWQQLLLGAHKGLRCIWTLLHPMRMQTASSFRDHHVYPKMHIKGQTLDT